MKVEIWSDFICPFCYIGKRRFEEALKQFAHRDEVEVIYRSFELDPNAPKDFDYDVHGLLASKYGMSRERAQAMNADMTKQAADVGLEYRFDTAVPTNTFDAHRLAKYASGSGKLEQMTERLLQAYFTDSKHIGDHAVLSALADEAGLDPKEAADMLAGDAYKDEVRADEQEAAELGIRGVPFFVLNRKYGVSGAQPPEVLAQALQQAWEEEHPKLTLLSESVSDSDDSACTDGTCSPAAGSRQP